MNSSEFDRRFDDGESIIEVLDVAATRRQRLEQKCVNVDLPLKMVEQLDQEANRLGVTRHPSSKFGSPNVWSAPSRSASSSGQSVSRWLDTDYTPNRQSRPLGPEDATPLSKGHCRAYGAAAFPASQTDEAKQAKPDSIC
jgi:hypothetical protein